MKTQTNVTVKWPGGLHMRPATHVVQTAREYQSNIAVCKRSRHADAKSLTQILTLSGGQSVNLKSRRE
jgi:phosphotransferase system HPr (HPr) family protein